MLTSTRSRRSRFPRRSRSCCARGSPDSRRPLTRRSRSSRRWARLRIRCCERAGVAPDALEPAVGCARDHARGRGDSLHASASVVGHLPGPRRRSVGASTRGSRRSSTTRSCGPFTSRSRRTRRMPTLRPRSTKPWAGLGSRRGCSRSRALRACPSADSADAHEERHRRALAAARPIRSPGSGRAPGRSRPICWPRPRSARGAWRRSSFSPGWNMAIARPSCSRRRYARRPPAGPRVAHSLSAGVG